MVLSSSDCSGTYIKQKELTTENGSSIQDLCKFCGNMFMQPSVVLKRYLAFSTICFVVIIPVATVV